MSIDDALQGVISGLELDLRTSISPQELLTGSKQDQLLYYKKILSESAEMYGQSLEDSVQILSTNQQSIPNSRASISTGYSTAGRGTPMGDGKDIAMRKVSNAAIVELGNPELKSSSRTTLEKLGTPEEYLNSVGEDPRVVMLARNGSLRGKPLRKETVEAIRHAHERGAKFVVGDMPGVDQQFVNLLDEIGAEYTLYAANKPRISFGQGGALIDRGDTQQLGGIVDDVLPDEYYDQIPEHQYYDDVLPEEYFDELMQDGAPRQGVAGGTLQAKINSKKPITKIVNRPQTSSSAARNITTSTLRRNPKRS